MRKAQVIAVALFAVIHAGCKSIPVAELANYQKAFGEVQRVSEDMLLDLDRTLHESRVFVERVQPNPDATPPALHLPSSLEEFSKDTGHTDDRDVQVRKQALDVIERYNEALSILASGESVREVQSATEGFGSAVTQFIETAAGSSFPAAGAVIGMAKTVVAQIEKARLRQQFETAVKDGAPLVDRILEELKADTEEHYKAAWVLENRRATLTVAAIVDNVAAINRLYGAHATPDENEFESMTDRAATLNELLRPLEHVLSNNEFPYEFSPAPPAAPAQAGPPPVAAIPAPPEYTTAVDVEIQSQHKEILSLMSVYRSQVDKVVALGKALNNYRALLDATRNGLHALRSALDTPQKLEPFANEMFALAFQIKRDIEAIRAPSTASP